jgi:hypothetical protein
MPLRKTGGSWSSTPHTWLGLTAGLLVTVLEISGAAISNERFADLPSTQKLSLSI